MKLECENCGQVFNESPYGKQWYEDDVCDFCCNGFLKPVDESLLIAVNPSVVNA